MILRVVRNQRGVVLPMIGVAWVALLSATAIGAGIGRLTLASTEVQNAADVAALAGAAAVLKLGDPEGDALSALSANEIALGAAAPHLQELVVGSYDFAQKQFIANGDPSNSVMARVMANVDNVFGGLIQRPNQNVEKIAYATLTGLRGGRPTLPVVIGDCNFQQDCYADHCMPRLTQVPNTTDTAGWTAFFQSSSSSAVTNLIPSPCGGGNVQTVWVGDVITLNNGQVGSALQAVECLINQGNVQHLIPIVPCQGSFNQAKPILGFATIVLESVAVTGGNKGMNLHAIFKSDAIGVLGGSNLYGTGNIALVSPN